MEEVNVLETTNAEEVKEEVTEQSEETVNPEEPEKTEIKEVELTPEEKFEKKKKTARERINDLTAKNYRLQKELEEIRKTKVEPQKPVSPNIQQYTDEYGNIDHSKYDQAMSAYQDAYYDYKKSKDVPVVDDILDNIFDEELEKASEKYPGIFDSAGKEIYGDFLQVALKNKAAEDRIEGTSVCADLINYLGKNENDAKRLSRLHPEKMLVELGKLEEKLANLKKNTSKAVEPINPVGASKGSLTKGLDGITDDTEWIETRRRQKFEKLRKRIT